MYNNTQCAILPCVLTLSSNNHHHSYRQQPHYLYHTLSP